MEAGSIERDAGNFQREDVREKAAAGRERYWQHYREFKAGERSDPPIPKTKERKPKKPSSTERKAKPAEKERAELLQIQEQLATLLALPALGMDLAGDEWPASWVRQQGPNLAHAIVERARINPAFRAQLLRVMRVSDQGNLIFAGLSYAVPVLLYYEVLPLYPLRRALGVPGRDELRIAMPDGSEGRPLSPEEQRAMAEAIAAEDMLRQQEAERNAASSAETPENPPVAPQAGPGPG